MQEGWCGPHIRLLSSCLYASRSSYRLHVFCPSPRPPQWGWGAESVYLGLWKPPCFWGAQQALSVVLSLSHDPPHSCKHLRLQLGSPVSCLGHFAAPSPVKSGTFCKLWIIGHSYWLLKGKKNTDFPSSGQIRCQGPHWANIVQWLFEGKVSFSGFCSERPQCFSFL